MGMIKLLKRLKETPKQMTDLLQNLDKSIKRIHALRSTIQQPDSLFTHLSITQIQRVTTILDDAC